MSKQKRILALWDYNSFTGFATVSKNLMANFVANLGDSYKIDIVAVNYFGEDYNEGENVRVISAKMKDAAKDDFGRHVFMRSLIDVEYDLIFILQDLGVVVPMIKYMREIKEDKIKKKQKPFKSILYFPVDFELTPNLGVGLEFFDYLATYTEYGRKYANAVNKNIAHKLNVIPHGNNPENFYSLEKSKALDFRKEYFGKNADKFIVTNVNRNQSRKDIPNTIFGFLEYWQEVNKNSFLYLHMDENDPMGWNLRTILNQTPLKEGIDYSFPPKGTMSKGASVEVINGIYNASDVFLTTTVGEGWGLSITEAMACKLPIIAPNHTSVGEICKAGERAYMLETLYPTVAMVDNVIRFQCDLYEISDTLTLVENHIKSKNPILQNKVESAYAYVNTLGWEKISMEFIKAIRNLTK